MGLYTTTTSLETRMVNVTFDTATSALAVEMISDAEAEVNKWLSRRYDLSSNTFQTTTSIPPVVRAMSARLAEGYMWKSMSRGGKESLTRGQDLVKDVMSNLESIAKYETDLTLTNGSLVPDNASGYNRVLSNTDSYSNTFNEDEPLHWSVDDDKLNDIDSERS